MDEQTYVFKSAFVEQVANVPTWQTNVSVTVAAGIITRIETLPKPGGSERLIDGVAIPAMTNVHSHAFQRAFAGLSEFRTSAQDSFWTWRKLMYDFVGRLTPEDVFIIARQLYLEMLTAGYSWVGEFHYLHNSPSGSVYSNLGEMAEAVLQAARETGIGICLLPVIYQRSGFDSHSANESQRRFVLDNDQFFRLLEHCQSQTTEMPNAALGVAVHSLRAVGLDAIRSALDYRSRSLPGCPVHIHVAEQTKEVEDCLAVTGKRSVDYLCSNIEIDSSWCLIHATHLNQSEIAVIADSQAVVGLCPTTEANLGDGFFPAQLFLESGGQIAIGSDSHCSIDMREEIRILEYGQRLQRRQRAVLGTKTESVGRRLFRSCTRGGAQAIGVATGRIAVGCRADLLVVDDQHPSIAGAREDRLLDRLFFCNAGNPISSRMIQGTWIDESALTEKHAHSSRVFRELNNRLRQ